jgi:hypothetical protein
MKFQPTISHHTSCRQTSPLSPLGPAYRRLSGLFLSKCPHKIFYIFIVCHIFAICPSHFIGLQWPFYLSCLMMCKSYGLLNVCFSSFSGCFLLRISRSSVPYMRIYSVSKEDIIIRVRYEVKIKYVTCRPRPSINLTGCEVVSASKPYDTLIVKNVLEMFVFAYHCFMNCNIFTAPTEFFYNRQLASNFCQS